MLCDVWTLARNARKLAFHPWARGRTAVVGSLCDAPIGSSTSSPATSQHGSSLDGSLPSMLLAFCPHGALLDGSLLSTPWTSANSSPICVTTGRIVLAVPSKNTVMVVVPSCAPEVDIK
ncbi:hypothetical protein EMIHUDRAFT_237635 [Emiliania huxleyi CCMP1516]|uniref:Uncharacterized protein n=2 Tax=Emiliania huxleyi TaxID=2903 RepID=A0A0D3JPS8_EMIH1|nr:hypothetical protein EMIHUDRAFT_237635 [Emiliania huxleyi CCMP1516]EOD25513.1 hypothetical protein EMIHUDRAFT_237635 [Emiliania huxleyi CCMP1516]|eukprot:XP_005777942.1 hypothetical protein EMIHUDRAFT_237635 [Emiliania huxleyi CCMP1516]